jgi:hypothetical protein
MTQPVNAGSMTFHGKLINIEWEKEDADAMDYIYERGVNIPEWVEKLKPDAHIEAEGELRHFTHDNGVAVFFRWVTPPHLDVYAVGRHTGNSNKKYKLHTFESGTKTKLYEF